MIRNLEEELHGQSSVLTNPLENTPWIHSTITSICSSAGKFSLAPAVVDTLATMHSHCLRVHFRQGRLRSSVVYCCDTSIFDPAFAEEAHSDTYSDESKRCYGSDHDAGYGTT